MCGILGHISKRPISTQEFKNSLDYIHHRGPDHTGFWFNCDHTISLGFKRLSIIDLHERSNQPYEDINLQLIIQLNGEIYNFKDLRDELEHLGYEFNTNSDTEAALFAFKEWGPCFTRKLSGMYSISIFDKLKNKLFLFRDFTGEKPLFYFLDSENFIFSSDPIPVLEQISAEKEIDAKGLNLYFKYGFSGQDRSLFKGINKLEYSSFIEFDISSWRFKKSFLSPINNNLKDSSLKTYQDLLDKLEKLLESAVSRALIADVPVGVLLSGGLDSSILVAIASKLKNNIKTFTASFPGSNFDESEFARSIANYFKTDHYELEVSTIGPEILDESCLAFTDPISDPSQIPTLLLSRLVSKHCKTVIGGDGADELFGGYRIYNRFKKVQALQNFLPIFLKNKGSDFLSKNLKRSFKGRGLLELIFETDFINKSHATETYFTAEERKTLLGNLYSEQSIDEAIYESKKIYDLEDPNDFINKIMFGDMRSFLSEDMLVKTDRASMFHSLEVRSPFLDKDIIHFAFSELSSNKKITFTERKKLLKDLATKILPHNFDFNRKQGFILPTNSLFIKSDWNVFYTSKLEKTNFPINKDFAFTLIEKHHKNPVYGPKLFSILNFINWHEFWFEKAS